MRLSDDGKYKYRKAREKFKLSEEDLSRFDQSGTGRGKSRHLTHELLAEKLGGVWYVDKVKRFFNSTPKYPVEEHEAREICDFLGIEFDPHDYVDPEGDPLVYPSSQEGGINEDSTAAELEEAQKPCNPIPLRVSASDGSIPDPFKESDFHLKVSVEETVASRLQITSQANVDDRSLSCNTYFSLFQGKDRIGKTLMAGASADHLSFAHDDAGLLIDRINELLGRAWDACVDHLGDQATDLRLHLHLLLPVTWLSGPLPEAVRQGLAQRGQQVFYGCSKRADMHRSAVSQLRIQAIKVNKKLHSGSSLSSLDWATVSHLEVPPIPATLFPAQKVLHLIASTLDCENDHCELVGFDALLAADHRLLFSELGGTVGDDPTGATLEQRWRRLVEIGLPLMFWWRGNGTPSESPSLDRIERILKGSWGDFCAALQLLTWKLNSLDKENEAMKNLLTNLGIFYEDPLRRLPPAPYRHPLYPVP